MKFPLNATFLAELTVARLHPDGKNTLFLVRFVEHQPGCPDVAEGERLMIELDRDQTSAVSCGKILNSWEGEHLPHG